MRTLGIKGPTPIALIPLPHSQMLHFFLLTKETVPLYLDKTQRDGPKQYNAAISKRPLPFSMDSGARGNHHSMHVEDGIISVRTHVHTCPHSHARANIRANPIQHPGRAFANRSHQFLHAVHLLSSNLSTMK